MSWKMETHPLYTPTCLAKGQTISVDVPSTKGYREAIVVEAVSDLESVTTLAKITGPGCIILALGDGETMSNLRKKFNCPQQVVWTVRKEKLPEFLANHDWIDVRPSPEWAATGEQYYAVRVREF